MPYIKVNLTQETYDLLKAAAEEELRPIEWEVAVIVMRALQMPRAPQVDEWITAFKPRLSETEESVSS